MAILDACGECAGVGAAKGSSPVSCSKCGGSGEQRQSQRTMFGQFVNIGVCSNCRGQGLVILDPCGALAVEMEGYGFKEISKSRCLQVSPLKIFISLYRGKGNIGSQNGPRGDTVVLLEVQEDDRFFRDGPDLYFELPITFSTGDSWCRSRGSPRS